MPNVAAVLKAEISRLAKREIKANTSSTKGAVAEFRRDIARLKRELQEQRKRVAFLESREHKRLGQPEAKKRTNSKASVSRPARSRPSGHA